MLHSFLSWIEEIRCVNNKATPASKVFSNNVNIARDNRLRSSEAEAVISFLEMSR